MLRLGICSQLLFDLWLEEINSDIDFKEFEILIPMKTSLMSHVSIYRMKNNNKSCINGMNTFILFIESNSEIIKELFIIVIICKSMKLYQYVVFI